MNDRAISAPQLLHEFLSYYTNKERDRELYFVAAEIKQHFADLLSDQPTLDVEPVKHGRWIDQYGDGDWHCSQCGAIVEKDEQIRHYWQRCYHCGAIMNKEE